MDENSKSEFRTFSNRERAESGGFSSPICFNGQKVIIVKKFWAFYEVVVFNSYSGGVMFKGLIFSRQNAKTWRRRKYGKFAMVFVPRITGKVFPLRLGNLGLIIPKMILLTEHDF
jgi:hypothetical protein